MTAWVFEKHLRCLNSDRKDKGGVEAVAAVLRRAAKDTQSSLGSYYVWMDYSSLRQCQSDFKPELVVSLIDKIGRDGASGRHLGNIHLRFSPLPET